MKEKCTLVIFSCEGREHLMRETYKSATEKIKYDFEKVIVSHDGQGGGWAVENISPDVFLQSPDRKGYVPSIRRAIKHIETEYFFWLEEDWKFRKNILLEKYLKEIDKRRNASQLLFLKRAPTNEDIKDKIKKDIYISGVGFSANPGINRTSHISKAIFDECIDATKNIEHHVQKWADKNSKKFLVAADKKGPYVEHLGSIEATGGSWHTMGGEKKTEKVSIWDKEGSLLERLKMIPRLVVRMTYIACVQLLYPRAHSLSWRLTNAVKIYKEENDE